MWVVYLVDYDTIYTFLRGSLQTREVSSMFKQACAPVVLDMANLALKASLTDNAEAKFHRNEGA